MSPTNIAVGPGQFGDTTYTKVFVGGLAWETQKETMKNYFEQFGEILEAVVITDKSTGRSKGYGFVTFKEAEAAMRSCVDAAPVIDGRRANCNLASLGVQRSKPSTPKHSNLPAAVGGNVGRNFRVMNAFQAAVGGGGGGGGGGLGTPFTSAAATTFPHYAVHQGIPYNYYGYSAYSGDYAYPASYYNIYGGAAAQYPMYGSNGGGMLTGAAYYPYLNMGTEGGTNTAASIHYPQQHNLFNYSAAINAYPHHYATGAPISLPPATPAVCFAVPQA